MLKGVKGFSLDVFTMRLSSCGLYMQGMDQSHVCLFEYKIGSSDVSKFDWDDKKDASCLSVSAVALDKVLHCYRQDQSISIETKGASPIEISFTYNGSSCPETKISIPLHSVEGDDLLTVPTVEFDVDVSIPAVKMSMLVDQLALFSDRLNVCCSEEGMVWKASGDSGTVSISMDEEDALLEYAVVEGANVKQTYNVRFLKMACSLHGLRKEVALGISNEHPFSMRYILTESGYAAFYVAPCIDD